MTTHVDEEKLDDLLRVIEDRLRSLLEHQMHSLEEKSLLSKDKWPEARKGLASAYVSAAEAQSAAMWGLDTKAVKHRDAARATLADMLTKLETPE